MEAQPGRSRLGLAAMRGNRRGAHHQECCTCSQHSFHSTLFLSNQKPSPKHAMLSTVI